MATTKLCKRLGILVLSILSISLKAQTEADFQNFGASFYQLLGDTGAFPNLEYIRIKTLRQFIDEQALNASEKEEWKLEVNAVYNAHKMEFERKLGDIVESYRSVIMDGGSLDLNGFDYTSDPKWKNKYQCSIWLFYQLEGLSTFVEIQFELYYNGKGLVFMGTKMDESF